MNINHRKALFLDRDGVIFQPLPRKKHILSWNQCVLMEGLKELIQTARDNSYYIFIVTNQPQVALGLLPLSEMHQIHSRLQAAVGGLFDRIYTCPHQDSDQCLCRKPKTSLFEQALKEFQIDPSQSLLIGDSDKDIEAGQKIGCQTVFIRNKYNSDELKKCQPDHVIQTLTEALSLLV